MTWESLGEFDPNNPLLSWLGRPNSPETEIRAVAQWFQDTRCSLGASFERAYRDLGLDPLATLVSRGRAASGCYVTPPNSFVPVEGLVPFEGGQCETRYSVNYTAVTVLAPGGIVQNISVDGPFLGFRIGSSPSNPDLAALFSVEQGGDVEVLRLTASLERPSDDILSAQVNSLSRQDGGPDDCGDPPAPPPEWPEGVELPPSIPPGDVINEGDIVTIDVDIGGINTPVGIEIGPVTFNPEFGLMFNAGGFQFNLSPSFSLSFSLIGGGDGGTDLEPLVRDILQRVSQDIAGSLTISTCSMGMETVDYSGEGLQGLQSQLAAVMSLVNFGQFEQCPIDTQLPAAMNRALLGEGVFSVNEVVRLPVPDSARALCLEVGGDPPRLRVFKPAGDETEAVYGYWCTAEEVNGVAMNNTAMEVVTQNLFLPIGRARGFPRSVRVSLKRGVAWKVYALEI